MTSKVIILVMLGLFLYTFGKAQRSTIEDIQHKAVLKNALEESRLPPVFLNRFYKDPKTRMALEKSSWFGPGEMLVTEREADRVPRREIFNVLNHAGLLPQQRL